MGRPTLVDRGNVHQGHELPKQRYAESVQSGGFTRSTQHFRKDGVYAKQVASTVNDWGHLCQTIESQRVSALTMPAQLIARKKKYEN